MPIGSSGRVVIEVSPELKHQLHELLRRRGTNLKEWFVDQAVEFLEKNNDQLELKLDESRTDGRSGA